MKRNILASIGVVIGLNVGVFNTAQAALINFNDFYADASVDISPNGSSAVINEDPSFFNVELSNSPALGDPQLFFPSRGLFLTFDYSFQELPGNDDEFVFSILDESGFSLGSTYEFSTQSSGSGQLSFDLTGLTGRILGLSFQLSSLLDDAGFNSHASVSNLKVVTATVPVPKSSSMILMLSALMGIMSIRRKYR